MLARGRMALAENAGSIVEHAEATLYTSIFIIDDDPHEGIRLQLAAAELARRAGHRSLETVNLLNAAEGAILLGSWDEARAALSSLRQRELAAPGSCSSNCRRRCWRRGLGIRNWPCERIAETVPATEPRGRDLSIQQLPRTLPGAPRNRRPRDGVRGGRNVGRGGGGGNQHPGSTGSADACCALAR